MRYLVVTDMQKDFVDGSLGSSQARKIVPFVCEKIKDYTLNGGRIICTADTHGENYLQTLEGIHLPVKHCIKGTDGWLLNDDVINALNGNEYKMFEKKVFGSVELAQYLRDEISDGDVVEIIGLCTDICVVSNALLIKAFCTENDVIVDAKCCAGTSVESHNSALVTMKSCQCIVRE